MMIVIRMKQDMHQDVYWSGMLVHEDRVMLEVCSQTFHPYQPYNKWKQYEMVVNRLAKELMEEGGIQHQKMMANMFIEEPRYKGRENSTLITG